jgi:phosphomannomutase
VSEPDLQARARDWLADDPDPETRHELADLLERGDVVELADRFAGLLSFGTAGLRGAVGAGPNRMNVAVVIRAAAAIAAWVRDGDSLGSGDSLDSGAERRVLPAVVVGFDARHRSTDFAAVSAEVLAAAGVRALLLPRPVPTPVLAFAVTHLGASAGIMVTASHNPPTDNGYKVYDGSGRQIVAPSDVAIAESMRSVHRVSAVPRTGPDDPDIVHLDDAVEQAYVEAATTLVDPDGPRQVTVAHTALHGVAAAVFRRVVARAGFGPVAEVAEQAEPDPSFPTVAFPNPEEPGALDLGIARAAGAGAHLLVAHDPDGDRLGIAVPDPARGGAGDPAGWRTLRGDEIGVLLAHHLLVQGRLDQDTVLVNTVVSSTLLARMAAAAGVPHVCTLTGFKWISRAPGPGRRLGLGYEEALGYCVDSVVADKDGLTAALVFMELVAGLRAEGRTVLDVLDELALAHGVHQTGQWVLRITGPSARERLAALLATLRREPPTSLGSMAVAGVDDLLAGDAARGLAPTDLLTFRLAGGRVVVRPSGTEPKLKCYIEVVEAVDGPADLAAARARAVAGVDALVAAVADHLRVVAGPA